MRPEVLNPLFASVENLKGIGPKLSQWIQKLCGSRIIDLLWHYPVAINQRLILNEVPSMPTLGTIKINITEHQLPRSSRQPYLVFATSELGEVQLVFFHHHSSFLSKKLAIGSSVWVSGQIIPENHTLKIIHPDYIEETPDKIPQIEAVYPMNAGISGKIIHKLIAQILPILPNLPEEINPDLIQQKNWPTWQQAICKLHTPTTINDVNPQSATHQRLAFDELFATQVALHLIRRYHKHQTGLALPLKNNLSLELPFNLTNAQERCLKEIRDDLASSSRMIRLLQGDVGSGKTIVALLGALQAIENKTQVAFLAPTDILARQHFATIQNFCKHLSIHIELLTAREKGKKRQQILDDLGTGKIQLIIGTHALLQENVNFQKLGLAIIDEQHRFGVKQRLILADKQVGTNVLVMTATPIPRTLTLTAYGDMDISVLDEKPAGRQPIDTRVLPLSQISILLQHLKNIDTQVYWVCPLVEESEKSDLMAAQKRFEELKKYFGENVGLIHGKMKAEEKEKAMSQFISKKTRILVSTTVIEVGVDVPSAGIMIVEHAERFGLATLHQLRGRVGRGQEKANCILLHGRLSPIAKERLSVLRNSQNGFEIAEADLRLRGAGELLGIRQSGLPLFHFADPLEHADLLALANREATLFLQNDPELQTNRGQALKNMLYLFGKDETIQLLKAG